MPPLVSMGGDYLISDVMFFARVILLPSIFHVSNNARGSVASTAILEVAIELLAAYNLVSRPQHAQISRDSHSI